MVLSPEVTFNSAPYLPEDDLLLLVATGHRRQHIEEQGLEQVAALELVRLYGPGVWERAFGQSRGRSIIQDINVTTESSTP